MADSRVGGAWVRTLELVTSRFEVCGVRNPLQAAVAWCRDPEREWLHSARADRILVESTRAAIARRSGRPLSGSTAPYLVNEAQMHRILEAPDPARMVLVLTQADGLSMDEVAGLLGMTVTAVRLAISDVEDELAELADDPLPGAAESGHLSTLQMRAFQAELLDPLPMQQHEQHVTDCSLCFARFDAWARHQEQFVLPKEAPRRRSWLLPLLAVGVVLLLVAGGTLTGVAYFLVAPPPEEPVLWRDAAPTVVLQVGEQRVTDTVAAGAIVQVLVDPHGGRSVGIVRETPAGPEVLAVVAMQPEGLQAAPVELLVPDSGTIEVHVVTGERVLEADRVLEAIRADGPTTAVTHVRLAVEG